MTNHLLRTATLTTASGTMPYTTRVPTGLADAASPTTRRRDFICSPVRAGRASSLAASRMSSAAPLRSVDSRSDDYREH